MTTQNNARGFFPDDDKWEDTFQYDTSMKVQTKGDEARTIITVTMTCGCGNKFIETQEIPGVVTMPEADTHIRSMAIICHRKYMTDSHQPQNPQAESDGTADS